MKNIQFNYTPVLKCMTLLLFTSILLFSSRDGNAQNFTSFNQSGNSDYFINVNWAANNPSYDDCDCHFWNTINISFANWPAGNGTNDNIFDVPAAASSSAISPFPIGPSRHYPTYGSVSWIGQEFYNDFFGVCQGACSPAAFVGPITTGTDLPYPHTLSVPIHLNDGGIIFNWTRETDIPNALHNTLIKKNGSLIATVPGSATTYTDPCAFAGEYYSFITQYSGATADSTYTITGDSTLYTVPTPKPSGNPPTCGWGNIKGKITTEATSSPVEGVLVTAELQNPGSISNGNCIVTYSDSTDAQGEYEIPFIYWGAEFESATFKVTPTQDLHGFSPAETTTTLDCGSHLKTIDFIDTTSFNISGSILDANGCGVDSAFIFAVNDPAQFTYSRSNGTYDLNVPQTGPYNVQASLDTLILGTTQILVDDNILGQDFFYNETDTLSLFVGASCNEYIGKADVAIRTEGGCLLASVQTDLDGRINDLVLPSREITVEITNIYPPASEGLDAQDILADIGAPRTINLDSTTFVEIFYRKPISFQFSGIPAPPCPAVEYPVFDQAKPYLINILVWESPDICQADTGYIIIQDNIASVGLQSTVIDTVPISNGLAQYNLIPGEPVLAAPHLKSLTFTAFVDSQMVTQTIQGIVSGARQRTATFVTGAPVELPYLILRDPPGDASYSFFNENATTTYAQSYSALTGTNIKAWAKLAVASNALFIKVFGEIGGGVTVGASKNDINEYKTTLSHNTSIKTSSDQDVVGEDGDLVYGAAVNFVYGIVDERYFDINTCAVQVDTGIMFSPDTFSTKFVKTIKGIREKLIPELNFFATNPDTTEEARRKFRNEARKWEQVIQMNEDMKADALKDPIDNYTIESAAGPFGLTTTGSATKSRVIEFKEVLNGNIAASAGVSLFGAITVSAGIEVTIRSEWGSSTTNSIQETTTTGFVFDDVGDGFNDEVSFDYAVDDVYGTPVFGDPIGRTSCPHEPGTQFIDFPEIVAPSPVKFATGSADELEFILNLRNNSESNNTRTYILDFVEQSNEFGVQVFSGANPFSGTIPFTIPAGGSVNTTVRVKKSQVSTQFSYEGLQFDLYPECEPLLKSTTFISAYFENDCPYVTMPAPSTNWVANSGNNNLIPITMDGYDLNPDVDLIKLVYSEIGDISWNNKNIEISGFNLQPPPFTYNWDVSGIPDGEYLIRWELYCGESVNVSTRICGLIDRKAPSVFGKEEPKDDLYHPGDKISVTFDEKVDFPTLQNGNYFVNNLTSGMSIPATILQNGMEIILDLGIDIGTKYNEKIEIGMIAVGDLYGNIRPDTVTWVFDVSEPDSDRDRIGDLNDRCPGGDDQKDTDMDGLPDDCDCLPTIPLNGRSLTKAAMDFDGVDDYFTFDSAYANVTNNFTYELWVNPKKNIPLNGVEANFGGAPFETGTVPHVVFPFQGTDIYGNGHATAGMAIGKNGVLVFEHAANYLPTTLVYYGPINPWTHVALSYINRQPHLYINGSLVKTGLVSGTTFIHPSGRIGGYDWVFNNDGYFEGIIDEFRLWNYALSESEIQSKMHQELIGNEIGLTTYFDFNEGTPFGHNEDLSIINDQSTNSFNGTMNGFIKSGTSSNWVTIPITTLDVPYDLCKNCVDTLNAAMDFDGANDYLSLANNDALIPTSSNSLTIELWVYPEDITGFHALVSSANTLVDYNFSFHLLDGHILATSQNGQVLSSNEMIAINEWSHVAVVFNPIAAQTSIFINGKLDITLESAGFGSINLGQDIWIGDINSADWQFNGKMDDLRFWNYPRTAEEIKDNLFIEMLGAENGLTAYYDFNQGLARGDNSGLSNVVDLSENGNAGSLINFNQKGGYSNWVASPLNFSTDADEDGRPDACDDCIPPISLMLENQMLDGMYMARDKITLGNGISFPPNANVLFRTPLLELFDSVNAPAGVEVLVNPEPCEEE